MCHDGCRAIGVVAAVALVVALGAPAAPRAQTASAKGQASWAPSKTPWGHPDLQGVWKAAESAKPLVAPAPAPRPSTGSQNRGDGTGAGPEHWYEAEPLVFLRQLIIVDPPDGRVPPLTPEGQKRASSRPGAMPQRPIGPEGFSPWDRCITRGVPGSMIPINYNNNYQFLQTPDHVVILYEMIHDVRAIPLNQKDHLPPGFRRWMGDARGHWDGNTLVIETTNFTDKTRIIYGDGHHSERLRLTERFTPVDADTIRYEFTVDDAGTWERPFTAMLVLTRGEKGDRLFEYACHEGNYGLANMLTGARADEKAAERAKTGNAGQC